VTFDNVNTTKDLGQLLRMKGINIASGADDSTRLFKPMELDPVSTFGATGRSDEAAVRLVYELVMDAERREASSARGNSGARKTHKDTDNFLSR
jgi:hypothetical protein